MAPADVGFSSRVLAALIGMYSLFAYLTRRARFQAREWGSDRTARLVQILCEAIAWLLGVRLDIVVPADGKTPSFPYAGAGVVAAASPHGALPLTQAGIGMALFRLRPDLKTFKLRNAAASVLFSVPGLRELILLMGARDASKRVLTKCLAQGYSVALNPGGNYEMASTSHTHEAIYCQQGLGFVRLAMAAGKPILPLYSFGENQLFVTSAAFLETRRWIARTLRIGLPIFFGRFGLPLGPPFPTTVTLVVGREISVGPPNANPTEAEVEAVFNRYLDEISRVWATYATTYLPASVAANGLRVERIGSGVIRRVSAL